MDITVEMIFTSHVSQHGLLQEWAGGETQRDWTINQNMWREAARCWTMAGGSAAERTEQREKTSDSSVCSARSGHARCTVCIFTSQAFSWHRHPEQIMISERARELQSRDNILQPCNDPAPGVLSSSRKNKAGRGSWWGGDDIKLSEINNSGFRVAFTCTSSFGYNASGQWIFIFGLSLIKYSSNSIDDYMQ